MTSSAPHGTDAGARPDQERATLTIGVDIGGTKVAAGVVDAEGAILETARRDTPADDSVKRRTSSPTRSASWRRRTTSTALGLGAAGFVNAERVDGDVRSQPAWHDEALRDAMEQRVGCRPWSRTTPTRLRGRRPLRCRPRRGRRGRASRSGRGSAAASSSKASSTAGGSASPARSGISTSSPTGGAAAAGAGVLGAVRQRARPGPGGQRAGDRLACPGPRAPAARRRRAGEHHGADGHAGRPGRRRRGAAVLRRGGPMAGPGMAQLAAILDPGVFVIGGGVSSRRRAAARAGRAGLPQAPDRSGTPADGRRADGRDGWRGRHRRRRRPGPPPLTRAQLFAFG